MCVVPIRYVVVVLGLLGCMLDYLMRFGLSVAIIAMTNATQAGNRNVTPDHACPAALNGTNNQHMVRCCIIIVMVYYNRCNVKKILAYCKLELVLIDDSCILFFLVLCWCVQQGEGYFSWTVQEQGIILGTFFWGYFFTKTIGEWTMTACYVRVGRRIVNRMYCNCPGYYVP